MANVFQTHVHVRNEETGDAAWFKPGDKAPSWTEGCVDPKHFEVKDEDGDVFDDEKADYSRMGKDDLVALAEDRGLDASGTKAEIIARLEENDAALA